MGYLFSWSVLMPIMYMNMYMCMCIVYTYTYIHTMYCIYVHYISISLSVYIAHGICAERSVTLFATHTLKVIVNIRESLKAVHSE